MATITGVKTFIVVAPAPEIGKIGNSTVVEHSPHNPKIKGTNSAGGTRGKGLYYKNSDCRNYCRIIIRLSVCHFHSLPP
jgi:hypothetical protein